ncbi:unnamed protein product [Rhodiola kirilowii]
MEKALAEAIRMFRSIMRIGHLDSIINYGRLLQFRFSFCGGQTY